jgi:hypothetical protein
MAKIETDARLSCSGAIDLPHGGEFPTHIERLATNLRLRRLRARQEKKAIDQVRQAQTLFQRRAEDFAMLIGSSFLAKSNFHLTTKVIDGSAQFVGNVRGESGQAIECMFQVIGHLDKGGRQEQSSDGKPAASTRASSVLERMRRTVAANFLDWPDTLPGNCVFNHGGNQ